MGERGEIWVWTISSGAGSREGVSKALHKWSSFHCKIKKKNQTRQLWSLVSFICEWELRKQLQNYSFQYMHFSFAYFRHLHHFCRRSLYCVLESSPSNSWAEDLEMLHSLLSTEKWLFLKLPGYYWWPNFSSESISVIQKQEVLWWSACEGNFVQHKVVLWSWAVPLRPVIMKVFPLHTDILKLGLNAPELSSVLNKEYLAVEQAVNALHWYLPESSHPWSLSHEQSR